MINLHIPWSSKPRPIRLSSVFTRPSWKVPPALAIRSKIASTRRAGEWKNTSDFLRNSSCRCRRRIPIRRLVIVHSDEARTTFRFTLPAKLNSHRAGRSALWARMIFFWPTVANRIVARRFLPEPARATILPGPYSGCVTVMPCWKTSGETRGRAGVESGSPGRLAGAISSSTGEPPARTVGRVVRARRRW